MADAQHLDINSLEFAQYMDKIDETRSLRDKFNIPCYPLASKDISFNDSNRRCSTTYLCGNSLGLQPVAVKQLLNEELDTWAQRIMELRGVVGHFDHPHKRPWASIEKLVVQISADIVGASSEEVAVMNTLTTNLHLLMVSFYRPTTQRYKILIESKAFPSDQYAVESQLRFHRVDPIDGLIMLKPRTGEYTFRLEDILDIISKEGDQIALVLISGIQYYTGQLFDIKTITEAGHAKGCVVGWDLAHAAGPGAIAGAFVHSKHDHNQKVPRFAGWWGNKRETRFQMKPEFDPMPGASGYQLSNPSVMSTICLLASLEVFASTNMDTLRRKSLLITSYLEWLLQIHLVPSGRVRIITPSDPQQRGCQLSLLLSVHVKEVMKGLEERGCVCDEREPDVIRVSPTPLYNRFTDCQVFVQALTEVLNNLDQRFD